MQNENIPIAGNAKSHGPPGPPGPDWFARELQQLRTEAPSGPERPVKPAVDVPELALTRPAPPVGPFVCRCGSRAYRDVPIHNGRSTRRDCTACNRFMAFVVWYGRLLQPSEN